MSDRKCPDPTPDSNWFFEDDLPSPPAAPTPPPSVAGVGMTKASALTWALDLMEMYEARLIQFGDPPHLVNSAVHVAGKALARKLAAEASGPHAVMVSTDVLDALRAEAASEKARADAAEALLTEARAWGEEQRRQASEQYERAEAERERREQAERERDEARKGEACANECLDDVISRLGGGPGSNGVLLALRTRQRAEAAEASLSALRDALGRIRKRATTAPGYDVEGALYDVGEIARRALSPDAHREGER